MDSTQYGRWIRCSVFVHTVGAAIRCAIALSGNHAGSSSTQHENVGGNNRSGRGSTAATRNPATAARCANPRPVGPNPTTQISNSRATLTPAFKPLPAPPRNQPHCDVSGATCYSSKARAWRIVRRPWFA
ncbi:hypothetical protein GCM10011610_39730 [Nocardia rhizosphaerihabitans]|uniref:Uncharacterized protein n=1 Tax=Nocardia rhizosphaerihabitans TaxID=1691570 RepID=A0ABQ2KK28_9NOCA|nr:hypothetical protein GCM10011610_39730 [Nocardia rhizosphaerihabitans]